MSHVNYPCIPEDIWFMILQQLPVKTLGRCRCVCKSWDSLVVSPSFMAAHLKSYTQNEANSLLLFREMSPKFDLYEQYRLFSYPTDTNAGNNNNNNIFAEAYHTSVCPFETDMFHEFTTFVGSIHGLLCLSEMVHAGCRIMIWNPFLRKYIYLPQSVTDTFGLAYPASALGFGYHATKNDHRVVKMSQFMSKDGSTEPNLFVEVYSVKEREWRTICASSRTHCIIDIFSSSHCYLNGSIHWLIWAVPNKLLGKSLILFDVEEEKFGQLDLPDALINARDAAKCECCIFEYQSKLSISCCQYDSEASATTSCQIWVKEEYYVESSWCKVLDIVLDGYLPTNSVKYLGRNGNNVFGFYKVGGEKLVVYDPKTGQTEELDLFHDDPTVFDAYTESLALLDQRTDVYTDYELPRLRPKYLSLLKRLLD